MSGNVDCRRVYFLTLMVWSAQTDIRLRPVFSPPETYCSPQLMTEGSPALFDCETVYKTINHSVAKWGRSSRLLCQRLILRQPLTWRVEGVTAWSIFNNGKVLLKSLTCPYISVSFWRPVRHAPFSPVQVEWQHPSAAYCVIGSRVEGYKDLHTKSNGLIQW